MAGYDTVEVPRETVGRRVAFILAAVDAAGWTEGAAAGGICSGPQGDRRSRQEREGFPGW